MRSLLQFSSVLVSLLSLTTLTTAQYQGTITAPEAGTKIQPGERFIFGYHAHGDYCVSSKSKLRYQTTNYK
jgi:hypothetical protein